MPRFIGEAYPVGVDGRELASRLESAGAIAAEMRSAGMEVRFVSSTLVPTEEALVCVFEADSAALVVELGDRAGLHLEHVAEALDVGEAVVDTGGR